MGRILHQFLGLASDGSRGQLKMPSASSQTPPRPAVRSFEVCARGSPNNGQSRLIIPGGGRGNLRQQSGQSSRLILPGQGSGSIGQESGSKYATIDTAGVQKPSTTTFRPPPGFMDSPDLQSQSVGALSPEQAQNALERLRAKAGHWHELAQFLPGLAAAGYDSQIVEFETGLARAEQSIWIVSQQVFDSLEKSGSMPADKLAYFNNPEGASMLYHMRFLPVSARAATATYMVDEQMNVQEASILARAVKEQERREGEKEGFSSSPADCLAYKYYRDAIESRTEALRSKYVKKGLGAAETESARAALETIFDEKPESIGAVEQQGPNLEAIRLTGDEVEFRPIALLGAMAETSASMVAAAAGVRQSGPYNAFTVTPETIGQQFVALPAFRSLLLARRPVALSVPNCAEERLILRSARARTDEDRRRQEGPGLIVIDRHVDEAPSSDLFYVCERGGHCELVEGGGVAAGEEVCGRVLFLIRPPARTAEARLDSYALMSL